MKYVEEELLKTRHRMSGLLGRVRHLEKLAQMGLTWHWDYFEESAIDLLHEGRKFQELKQILEEKKLA